MDTRRRIQQGAYRLLLAITLGTAGCSAPAQHTDYGLSGFTGKYPAGDTTTEPNWVSDFGSSLGKGVKAAGAKVAEALDVQPPPAPANDPASLASMPENLEPIVYVQFAHTAEQQGNHQAAKRYFERALEEAPYDISILVPCARFCDRHGMAELAVQVYEQALEAAPLEPLVLNDLGLLYARQGALDEALDHLQQAVQQQPDNVRYRNNLAHVQIALGNTTGALESLQAVLPAPTAHFNVALLLQEQGKMSQSCAHLTRAVELDPSFAAAMDLLARSQAQTYVAQLPVEGGRR